MLAWVFAGFVPELSGSVVESGADLGDDFHAEEVGGFGGEEGIDLVGDSVEESAGEHIASAGEVFGGAGVCGDVALASLEGDVGAVGSVGDDTVRDHGLDFGEGGIGVFDLGDGGGFGAVAEEEVTLGEGFAKDIAEDDGYEGIGAGEGDFGSMFFGVANGFTDGMLSGIGVGEDVAFDEEPFGGGDAGFIDMTGGELARDTEAGAHGSFGIGGDDGDAGAGGFADENGVPHIDL